MTPSDSLQPWSFFIWLFEDPVPEIRNSFVSHCPYHWHKICLVLILESVKIFYDKLVVFYCMRYWDAILWLIWIQFKGNVIASYINIHVAFKSGLYYRMEMLNCNFAWLRIGRYRKYCEKKEKKMYSIPVHFSWINLGIFSGLLQKGYKLVRLVC